MFQRSCTGTPRTRCFQRNVIAAHSRPLAPIPAPDSATAAVAPAPSPNLSPRQRRLAEQQRQWRLDKQKAQAREARMALKQRPAPVGDQPAVTVSVPLSALSSAKLPPNSRPVSSKAPSRPVGSKSDAIESEQLVKDILSLRQRQAQQQQQSIDLATSRTNAHDLFQEAQQLARAAMLVVKSLSLTQTSEAAWGLSHISRDLAQPLWDHMQVSFEVVPNCLPQLKLQDFLDEVDLHRDTIYLDSGARAVEESRLTGWQSDIGATFIYSGKEMLPQQSKALVQALQQQSPSLHANETPVSNQSSGLSQGALTPETSASQSDTSASDSDSEGNASLLRTSDGESNGGASSSSDSGSSSSSTSQTSCADGCGMTPAVAAVRDRLTELTGVWYDSVLINYYHDGRCGMRFHSDPLYDRWTPNTSVVSIGETRTFVFRETSDFSVRWQYPISNGDVVIMHGDCQERFQHCIKVERDDRGAANMEPRVSLVFKERLKNSTTGEYIM